MTTKERRWVIITTLIILSITSIPYFIGFMKQGDEWYFTGFVFGVEDGNSYIAKMLSGTAGNWLFRSPYSAYYQKGFIAFLPYLLIGKLVSGPGVHEQLVALFHLFRWLAGISIGLASYKFLSLFIDNITHRKIGTIIILAGGGLGWISIFGLDFIFNGRLPLEFYSPESFSFLSIYGLPHLAMARALLLWGFVQYLDTNIKPVKSGTYSGITWLIMGFFQPLYIVIGWIVMGAHNILLFLIKIHDNRDKRIIENIDKNYSIKMFISIAISSAFVLYTLISFDLDPYLNGWAEQNIIKSPPIIDYIASYSIFIPLAIISVLKIIKNRDSRYLLLVAWIVLFPILTYSPFNMQRRLIEGWWVVLITLSMVALVNIGKIKKYVVPFIITLSMIGSFMIIYGGILSVQTPMNPLYRSAEEIKAIKELGSIAQVGDVVLASYEVSNVIPAWAPLYTLIGHGPESVNLKEVEPQVSGFYNKDLSKQHKEKLIKEFDIKYIFFGPYERSQGNNEISDTDLSLQIIYDDSEYIIFDVEE